MITCSVRTHGECSCSPSECRASKPTTLAASIMVPSWKTQAITCAFLGVISAIASFAVLSVVEPQLRISDLVNQEANASAHRR